MRPIIALTLLVTFIQLPCAKAAVIASEFFNYTTGNLDGRGSGANPGWSGSWGNASPTGTTQTVTSGSLDSPVFTGETGNKATLSGDSTNSSFIYRSLDSAINSGTIYLGFVLERATSSNRTGGLFLYSGTTTQRSFFGFSDAAGGAGELQILANTARGFTGDIAAQNTPVQLVAKIQFNASGLNEKIDLFVNQSTEGLPDATLTTEDIGSAGFDTIRLFAGGGASTQTMNFDEINLTTTYAEAIPEPSSLMLLLISSTLFCILRRRH